jgi:uncharacterized protein (TIGR03435 family)
MKHTVLAAIVIGTLASLVSTSQADGHHERFEVTSVKAHTSNDSSVRFETHSNGRVTAANITVEMVITYAYGIKSDQLIGGPSWIRSDRYDVEGVTTDESARKVTGNQMKGMLQSLLADRFHLVVNYETRDRSEYALLLADLGGRLGPRLQRSQVGCKADDRPTPESAPASRDSRPSCGTSMERGSLKGAGQPMRALAVMLSGIMRENIVDRTTLGGMFDFSLRWETQPERAPDPASEPSNDVLSLCRAIEDQLGLTVKREVRRSEVVVIESIDRPTPDWQ